MEHIALRDVDSGVDLESGEATTSEDDTSRDSISSARRSKTLLAKVCGAFGDEAENGECCVNSCHSGPYIGGIPQENVKVVIDKNLEEQETSVFVDKERGREKCKKKSAKKAPKPPRPPRGPSLDAADQKLIREMNELALLKRARIERVKQLKKMKATKSSSSNSNLFAMVFTVLFCLVILFQGMSTRSSPVGFHGSPESTAGTEGNLISVQYHKISSAQDTNGPVFGGSSILVEQASGSEPQGKGSEAEGVRLQSS